MVGNETCENHDKVYANYILCSSPPQQPWVCKKCGEQGTDRLESGYSVDSYSDILDYWRKRNEINK